MKNDTPNILLVNPWIHDFAAYDFWAKPVGLLTLASILEKHGFTVSYIDCLDRFHPRAPQTNPYARSGRGPYLKTRIPKPEKLEDVPRYFSRYGIRQQWFVEDLLSISRPDLILVTSHMTYWYPGVHESIKLIKEVFHETPVVLGGIYATLCFDYASEHSGADMVTPGQGEEYILDIARQYTGYSANPKFDPNDINTYPYPAFDLQKKVTYIPILTSKGCPFSCRYCASGFLNPKQMRRDPELVVEEIKYWHKKFGVIDFVFYDDALLVNPDKHAVPIFEGIIKAGIKVRFHTPNAVHIREISKKTATLMYKAGFTTLRLGLETAVFDRRNKLDKKVTEYEFQHAAGCLKNAGFDTNQIGAYLLVGIPGQSLNSVSASIRIVKQYGIKPVPAYYTPIPHTALWKEAVASSRYDLESDPIFTNNSILPCHSRVFSWKIISYLKDLAGS